MVSNALKTIAFFWLSLGECVSEHGKAAHRFGLGRLVLQNVPMLFKKTVFEPDDVGGDPGGGPSHPCEAAMRYDVIAFCDDVLDVVRRPEAFRRRIVTLVEQCLECFEHDCLIPLWGRVAHCFSCACDGLSTPS